MFPTANGECSTSCRQKVRFSMFSCYFLRIMRQSIQVLCPVFSRKVFFRGVEGSNKVWTSKTSLSVSRQDFAKILSNVAAEWFLQPNSPKYCMYRSWQPMTCYQNRLITSLELAFSFGKRFLPGTNKLACTESGMRLFLYLIKNKPDTSYARVISWWENNASCLCYC